MDAYFDNSATTQVFQEVIDSMIQYFRSDFGNPGSTHSVGQDAAEAVVIAREQVSEAIGCKSNELYFTSGGTESDNWAIQSAIETTGKKHVVSSVVEHKAVLAKLQSMEKQGVSCTLLPVDSDGLITPGHLQKVIRPDTALVSIMTANNETGTIQPIETISTICREKGVLFHTDSVQAFCKIPFNYQLADMVSISAHKIHGPKGIGALYVRNGVPLAPLLHGGGQESGMRSGTVPVPLVVGFGKAAYMMSGIDMRNVHALGEYLEDQICKKIDDCFVNGQGSLRVPGIVNVCFRGVESHMLVKSLSYKYGISCSSGSACSSKTTKPSHVLKACGLSTSDCHSSVRFSVGCLNTEEEVDYLLDVLPELIASMRLSGI